MNHVVTKVVSLVGFKTVLLITSDCISVKPLCFHAVVQVFSKIIR